MRSEITVPSTDLDLSTEVRDFKSNDTITEVSPISEGFILLSDSRKKHTQSNISTTPCKNTTTVMNVLNHTMNSIENYSLHHRNRRLLNEVNDDTGDVGSFLRVADDDQLAKQFINLAVTADGSGFSMYRLR